MIASVCGRTLRVKSALSQTLPTIIMELKIVTRQEDSRARKRRTALVYGGPWREETHHQQSTIKTINIIERELLSTRVVCHKKIQYILCYTLSTRTNSETNKQTKLLAIKKQPMTKRVSCRSFRSLSCSSLLLLSLSSLLLLLHKEQQHGVFVASATTSSSVLRRGASTIGKRTLTSGAKRAARSVRVASSLKQSVQESAAAALTTGAAVAPSTISTVQSNFIAHFPASLNQLPTTPVKESSKTSLLSLLPKHLQTHKHKTAATSKYLKSALHVSQRPSTLATTSAVANSGFRQFSQRATRLQLNLQKAFSLRAIFGNCVTNNEWNHGEFNSDSHNANAVWRAPPFIRSLQGVVMETVNESVAGFVGGYLLAATTDVTRKVYRGVRCAATASATGSTTASAFTTSTTLLPYPSITKYSQQVLQSHARSMTWAMEWARISAVFAACRLAVHLARNTAGRTSIVAATTTTKHNYFSNIQSFHHDEDWNDVLGSALVGAIFAARQNHVWKLRPAAMTKGAILYGGTMFLLHPDLWKEGMEALWLNLPKNAAGACYEQWYDHQWMMIN